MSNFITDVYLQTCTESIHCALAKQFPGPQVYIQVCGQ